MSTVVAENERPAAEQGKVELRAPAAWISRVDREAARNGLSRSAYIRMVVTREMDRAEAERKARG